MPKVLTVTTIIFALVLTAQAGGPALVAGASFLDPSVIGTPLTWPGGTISYFTDQGNLSAILPGSAADSFVASAFSLWTSNPTAAVSAVRAGQLAENVNGSNISISGALISAPADIAPSATSTPIGIVYDEDGAVTDALLGTGASDPLYCADNSVFGGVDNFDSSAHFLHALIVINGNCAQTSAQLPDLQYHLVRVIGRVLGLDWSQANINVVNGNPHATADQIAGFPVMHEFDPPACSPVANCYSNNGTVNPAAPKTDDQAAISRLYPVTPLNAANFPGKQIFSQTTARIHGSVYFTDSAGGVAQPMQGVNVVARLIDPSSGQPSGSVVATSISGFLFCGNAGNIVTGFADSDGNNFNRFGSNDSALEGFFDLAGLPLPNGVISARYQLSVEAVDPLWSTNAGPYGPTSQVQPSGSFPSILVTVTAGGDVPQGILMQNSAVPKQPWYGTTTFTSPLQLPTSGNWAGALGGYGNTDYFQFSAQANRSLSVIVDALDDSGNVSGSKVTPVIGMWALADPGASPAPANTPSAFNTATFGETRLDADILQSTTFRLGIADYRGDGRPDFRYRARVLYGDNVNPTRASAAGGVPLTIQGLGLQPDTSVQISGVVLPVLASASTKLLVDSGSLPDGTYTVRLQDSASGGQSSMASVLTVGAGPADLIKMLSGINPATPVGGQAPVLFSVIVVAPDGITPVAGASIRFSSSPAAGLSACSGQSTCTVLSDQSGIVSTYMTPLSATAAVVTAALAPASYSNPKQVQTTLAGSESQLDLSLTTPPLWIAQGATLTLPISARVTSNGVAVTNASLNYQVTGGTATLNSTSAQTDSTGHASVNLQLSSLSASVRVSVCVAPNNSPCQIFNGTMVQASSIELQPVSGLLQLAVFGQTFQAATVRAVDSANPLHPVMGASVTFLGYIGRTAGNEPIIWAGESSISQPSMPVILAETQANVTSDANGIASLPIPTAGISGNVAVIGTASAGAGNVEFEAQQIGR